MGAHPDAWLTCGVCGVLWLPLLFGFMISEELYTVREAFCCSYASFRLFGHGKYGALLHQLLSGIAIGIALRLRWVVVLVEMEDQFKFVDELSFVCCSGRERYEST
jgi:hypothetical protein